ncbi:ABC-type nitrate/sulfonate/bicarbonate transport system permease component [Glaciihabitans tibetensis]|uniref:ABC-type nitrate/sulfonate/bicarbonate transport system permease component n=1 Tax=Glaciihabitans tibetensis TaxID=1266600 RepID=A0A2T0V4A1_9MICO|nr:ABC transporter permease subunit [Glaciihabitans tibetensis]PRY65003.1 ABC-type nitrate/sulfonate/bicarbonate transport system permease component [Glaciihabitans tibetensis]
MDRVRALPSWATGLFGVAVVIALWWLLAVTVFAGVGPANVSAIPTPWAVLQQLGEDGATYYFRHIQVTVTEAGLGFLWGNGLALALAAFVLVFPRIEKVALQIAVITYCLPIVAIGPIARLLIGNPDSGEPAGTAVFLAALAVFFTTVVGSLLGLKAADRASLDLVSVYGGGKLMQLRKVRIIAAIPAVLTALKIAAPAALLGAIIAEYLGGVERGLGIAMLTAGSSAQVERVWGLAIVAGVIAGLGYALFGLISRLVTPWSSGRNS